MSNHSIRRRSDTNTAANSNYMDVVFLALLILGIMIAAWFLSNRGPVTTGVVSSDTDRYGRAFESSTSAPKPDSPANKPPQY